MNELPSGDGDATVDKKTSPKPRFKRFLAFSKTGWGVVVAASVIISLVTGIIFLIQFLNPDPLKIGTTGKSGPLYITPHSVTCGKTVKDLPKAVASAMPEE